MKRTQISLEDDDRALLDGVSRVTGRSMSALVRDAVRIVYASADVDADLRRLDAAFGAWPASAPDGADYVDSIRTGVRWERLEH